MWRMVENGALLEKADLVAHMGEPKLQRLINWTLAYLSTLDLPAKRGTFIEFRTGMINVSPVGRGCSQEERNQFEEYDKTAKVRSTMVEAMKR